MENQFDVATIKKVPCNSCRERKRKCSYDQPCARCVKFSIECIYTVAPSPKDLEYIQELEAMKHIEEFQHEIICMENELAILKLAKENQGKGDFISRNYPSPKSDTESSFCAPSINSGLELEKSVLLRYRQLNEIENSTNPITEYRKTLIKMNELHAVMEKKKPAEPWTLTVNNGNMSIDTKINTYADLMSNLSGMVSSALYQKNTSSIPFPMCHGIRKADKRTIGQVLSVLIWRRYGKSRFKSLTSYVHKMKLQKQNNALATVITPQGLTNITLKLLQTFFHCFHLNQFSFHIPTFTRLFMNTDDRPLLQSPVVMALCSNICIHYCKHTRLVIPNDALLDYGTYYFEQARELISDQFDDANLETLYTYAFMGVFKLKTKEEEASEKYFAIADRITNILKPEFEKYRNPPTAEYITFRRIRQYIAFCKTILELYDLTHTMFKSRVIGPYRFYQLMDENGRVDLHIAEDDSPEEIRFLKMRRYLYQLRAAIQRGAQNAAAMDFPSYIGVFSHHIEVSMRHWYRQVLPLEFQLSLPLFEDAADNVEFFTKLELESRNSPIPIILLLSLYNEYLIMAKSYIPKHPRETQLQTEDLISNFLSMEDMDCKMAFMPPSPPSTTHERRNKTEVEAYFWLRTIMGMKHIKCDHHHEFEDQGSDETDEQFIIKFIRALNPSKFNFDMPIIHTSIKAALNMVKIIQFLLSTESSCFLDLRWVVNAWEVLLRAARFKYQQPGDKDVTLDRIRANLLLCIDFVEGELKYTLRDGDEAINFLAQMMNDLNEVFQ